MNEALSALYALQQVDSALALAQRQYQALDAGLAEKAAAETARTLYERLTRTHHETARDLQDAELELQSVETRKKKEEDKLYGGKVQAYKEIEAIQHEIEAMGRQRSSLDERILTLMDQVDFRRKEEQEAKSKLESAEAALADKQAAYKSAARALALQIQKLTEERAARAASVPPALLKKYDAIRAARGGVGIARIEEGMCGACHTSLPSFLIENVVYAGGEEKCENCGRLLCSAS